MTLSELMKNVTPSADFSGYVMADDMVLAIDTSEGQDAEVGDYAVVQIGIEGVDPSLNSETSEKNYLRAGKSSTKTDIVSISDLLKYPIFDGFVIDKPLFFKMS